MFEFDSDGFLTHRSGELEAEINAAHHQLFTCACQINHDCHELLFSADIRNRDIRSIIVATLFMRLLEHYQAVIVLLNKGVIAAARAALRALVETTFKMRAVATDRDALKAFIAEDLAARKKLINKARNNDYTNLEETRRAISDELVGDLEQQIQATGAKSPRTEDWSRRASMHDWYITNYALLSKAVHTQVRDLEAYLKIGESGEIEEFRYAPGMNDIPLLILTTAHCLLIGASAFDGTFELGFGPKGELHSKTVEGGFRALDEENTQLSI
ncbi:DUF5677 domain-containing protein [Nitratireductor thuwali]|uniref:HEPN AbiU2-like domain-containing protein n=1 Tax=Nitratireductor thuwali TaxID=2267699 RepID=A0ABY5MQ68_9HYPH|nr:hypothetical protein NTH_04574 [Nitratireductor thuwali]